jgi:mono/diheme cytochrome c family protein
MKTFFKVVGILVLSVAALAAIGVSWLALRKPAQQAAIAERIEPTTERLARGEYLVHHVTDCLGCHSEHTLEFGLPIKPGTEGKGGFVFDRNLGFPGVVAAQNITSDKETGLGSWTDGEILRAIREGVDRHGNALFPMMPYQGYRHLSDDDAKAIVAYLRTLAPVKNETPAKKIDFPVNLFVKFAPQPVTTPVTAPDRSDRVAYGKYLTTISGCYECHTPHDEKNQLITDKAFSGGWVMKGPWGRNITANITPHPSTWMGQTSREAFIGRFKAFATVAEAKPVPPGRNTIMPWLAFAGMTEDDLGAIYDYLRTVPAIENQVDSFPDAP